MAILLFFSFEKEGGGHCLFLPKGEKGGGVHSCSHLRKAWRWPVPLSLDGVEEGGDHSPFPPGDGKRWPLSVSVQGGWRR